jgi:hypothetical protein
MGIYFDGRKVLSWFSLPYPNPRVRVALNRVWGASATSIMQLGKTFVKQKL